MGIGDPLGKQLGKGVSKGLESALESSIGSFELLAERSTDKAIQGLDLLKAKTVEIVKTSDNAGVQLVKKEFEQIERFLKRFKFYNQLAEQPIVSRIVPKQEALRVSSSATFEKQLQVKKQVDQGGAVAQEKMQGLASGWENVSKVDEEITRYQKVLEVSSATLNKLRTKVEKGAVTEEESKDYQAATETIDLTIKNINELQAKRNDFIIRLKKQAEALILLGTEVEAATNIKQLIEITESFEEFRLAQFEIGKAKRGVKTNAKTPEAIKEKKRTVLEEKAESAKDRFELARKTSGKSIKEVQQLERVAEASQRALNLYLLELTNPAKEIETATAKIQAANTDLGIQLAQLGERLEKSVPKTYKSLSQLLITVENLNQEIKPLIKSQNVGFLNVAKTIKSQSPAKPKLYNNSLEFESVVQDTLAQIGVKDSKPIKYKVDENIPADAGYVALDNSITVKPIFNELLTQQKLTKENLGKYHETVELLVHEIVHGVQTSFGENAVARKGAANLDLPKLSQQQAIKIASQVEFSTSLGEGLSDSERANLREAEKQAYQAQYTIGAKIAAQRSKAKATQQFEQRFGFTGIGVNEKMADISAIIPTIQSAAKEFKVDFSQELEPFIHLENELKKQTEKLRNKAVNLQNLSSAEEILDLEEEFDSLFVKLDAGLESLKTLNKQFTQKVIQTRKAAAESPSTLENIEERLQSAIAKTEASIAESQKKQQETLDKANQQAREQALAILKERQGLSRPNFKLSSHEKGKHSPLPKDATLTLKENLLNNKIGDLPKTYKALVEIVALYSNLAEFRIPELTIPGKDLQVTFDKAGTLAAYLTDLNKVALKPELLKHLQSGQKLDYQTVGLSVHELRHAAQLGFGKLTQEDFSKGKFAIDLLVPTPQELQIFGDALEKSIAAAKVSMPHVSEKIIRAAEGDAYAFEYRYGAKIHEALDVASDAIASGIDDIDVSRLSNEDFAQYLEEGFDNAAEAVEEAVDEFADQRAALDAEMATAVASSSEDMTNQLDSLAAEVEATTAQASQSTKVAIAQGEQKLEAGVVEAVQAHQDLINKLADPGLTGEDIKEIAKLAEIPGRGAKGLKRKDREKLVAESVIKGETSPEALAQIVRAVETKRAKERIYKDTGIPKSETDWAKKTAGDLAQSSVEGIQDFGKQSQSVLQKAIVQAKAISDPTARLEELDRIRASIIEYQSAILEASGTHTDAAAKKHLEMLRVRLQSDRKSLGLAMTAAQSEITASIAQTARTKSPTLSGGGMEQAVRQNPGALFAAGAFGGQQPPLMEELEKEVEEVAKRAAVLEQEVGKAMKRGFITRLKRFFGLTPRLSPNEIAAKAEETVKTDISGQADRAEQMSLIRAATEGIRRRIQAAKPGEGLRKATQVLERLAHQEEREITQSVQQSAIADIEAAIADIEAAIADTERINQEFQQQQQRTTHKEQEALKDAIDERQAVRRRQVNLFERMGLKYGIFNLQAPELREELPQETSQKPERRTTRRTPPKLSLFNRIVAPGVTKQAEILAMNAQSLLGDIETQLAVAEGAEKDTKLLERQIKANEQRIEKLTRRQLTEGGRRQYGMGRLSDRQYNALESERTRLEQIVVEDKAKLEAGKLPRSQRKELVELSKSTKNALTEVSTILGKESLTDIDLKRLGQLRTQLAQVFEQMQQPIPGNNFLAQFGLTIPNVLEKLGGLIKGFFAFQGLMFVSGGDKRPLSPDAKRVLPGKPPR